MSYYEDPHLAAKPARPSWFVPALILIVVTFGLLIGGLYLVPGFLERLNPEMAVRARAVAAQMEADARFRVVQAELAAHAGDAAQRLDQGEISTSAFRDVVKRTGPAVVNISNEAKVRGRGFLDLPGDGQFAQRGEGSGVMVRHEKDQNLIYVITNSHVVRGADRLIITLQSGATLTADREGIVADPPSDLAMIRVKIPDPQPHVVVAEFADSDAVQPGDWAVAIGSPFGLQQTVTAGIISAKGRVNVGLAATLDDVHLIQTDAAINPGNSGGPLLDLKGRIVGINTAIFTRSGGNQGIGFAIPSKTVQQVFDTLAREGKIVRGFLGVGMGDVSQQDATRLGIAGGVLVTTASRNFPAHNAGIERGDVIITYDGKEITSAGQLGKLIRETTPGKKVTVGVLRLEEESHKRLKFEATIVERPPLSQMQPDRP